MATEVTNTSSREASPAGSRKRRRRAPATGASEDCHSCRKRGTPCDRKRPYCTQCLDLGKECSGYRTTLTWGVGVASRGKLRGMSLPVLGANKTPPTSAPKRSSSSKDASLSPKSTTEQSGSEYGSDGELRSPKRLRVWTGGPVLNGSAHYLQSIPENRQPLMPPTSTPQWQHMSAPMSAPMYSGHPYTPSGMYDDVHNMRSSVESNYDYLSSSTGSLTSMPSMSGAYSDTSLDSPVDLPQTPDAFTFVDPFLNKLGELPTPSTPTPPMPSSANFMPFGQIAPAGEYESMTGYPMKQEMGSLYQEQSSYFGMPVGTSPDPYDGWEMVQKPNLSLQIPGQGYATTARPFPQQIKREAEDMRMLSAPPSATSMPTSAPHPQMRPVAGDVSPRMQYLLDYYDKVICPSLVAFDGPANPYRRLVLPLAATDCALRNALAALSINNIRMKTIPQVAQPNRRKLCRSMSSGNVPTKVSTFAPSKPSDEEQHYKTRSIEHLNAQLTGGDVTAGDALLATLQILCLFHVCDSGFSRFRTQLAGVKKLMKMRGDSPPSELATWVEMFFTWFDVMLAPVNNREAETRGIALDMLDPARDVERLDHLCGCDGPLFRIIARLGRLNMLRQGISVRSKSAANAHSSSTTPVPRRSTTPTEKPKDFYSLDVDDRVRDDNTPMPKSHQSETSFWEEWKEVRAQLADWQPARSVGYSSPAHIDLMHVTKSYHNAALLYTERLSQLEVLSSHPNIQGLVERVLSHVERIPSSSPMMKFMLWPLFIAGTECTREDHRNTIRGRCIDIVRETGFYNNILTLDILENVWRSIDNGSAQAFVKSTPLAFHWRAAMTRTDGDYIVI